MEQRGDAAAETTSVLLTKPFTDCALPTPLGPFSIVGTRINSQQLGGRLWIP